MKYRLEYSAAPAGGPGWEFYGDFPSRAAAHEAARAVRRQFGPSTRTRIVPAADDAPPPKRTRTPSGSSSASTTVPAADDAADEAPPAQAQPTIE